MQLISYWNIVMGALAIVSNIPNLLILGAQKSLSPYIYMTWIAACDTLCGVAFVWYGVIYHHDFVCASPGLRWVSSWSRIPMFFLTNALLTSSSYLLVALGVDRLIAVRYPLKRALWCTKKTAHITSLVLVIAGIVVNVQILPRFEPSEESVPWCDVTIPKMTYTKIGLKPVVHKLAQNFKFVFKQALPLLCLVVTSIWTLFELAKSFRFRQRVGTNREKAEKNPCLGMSIGIIMVFILTNIGPSVYALSNLAGQKSLSTSYITAMLFGALSTIPGCNIFVNFFVYVLSNSKFRRDLKRLFSFEGKKSGGNVSQVINQSTSTG